MSTSSPNKPSAIPVVERTVQVITLPRPRNINQPSSRYYRFKDADPVLLTVCNLIEDSGLKSTEIVGSVYKATNSVYAPSPSTIDRWLAGGVKKPQNFIVDWVLFALGYERVIVRLANRMETSI